MDSSLSLNGRVTIAVWPSPITLVFKAQCKKKKKKANFSFFHHCGNTYNSYSTHWVRGPSYLYKLKFCGKIFYSFPFLFSSANLGQKFIEFFLHASVLLNSWILLQKYRVDLTNDQKVLWNKNCYGNAK